MKRREFYKKYYEITDRIFSDKVIWFGYQRKDSDRKGQIHISKLERKVYVLLQYISLALMILLCVFLPNKLVVALCGVILYLLEVALSDFSILKIEIIYKIVSKNTVYGTALRKIFFGEFDADLEKLRYINRKYIKGFVRENSQKLRVKYSAVCTNTDNTATLVFKPFSVVLTVNNKRIVIRYKFKHLDALVLHLSHEFTYNFV